jgi:hypothetical protein
VSMFRKTVLTTAIVGAGLASTAGAAFAGDDPGSSGGHDSSSSHHHSSHSSKSSGCSNSYEGETGKSKSAIGLLNSSQGALGLNVCDVLSHNNLLNGNHINVL